MILFFRALSRVCEHPEAELMMANTSTAATLANRIFLLLIDPSWGRYPQWLETRAWAERNRNCQIVRQSDVISRSVYNAEVRLRWIAFAGILWLTAQPV